MSEVSNFSTLFSLTIKGNTPLFCRLTNHCVCPILGKFDIPHRIFAFRLELITHTKWHWVVNVLIYMRIMM